MEDLQGLPCEIQLLVYAELDQKSLVDFSRTSKRNHEIVTPILYRKVWYWSEDNNDTSGPYLAEIQRNTETKYWSAATCDDLGKGSKIFHPTALTRTLTESAPIRSLVESVDIIWGYCNEDHCAYALLKALTSSPLKHLHISPPQNVFTAPPGANVTSLGLRNLHFGDKASLGQLCASSLALPSLRHVYFDGWYEFDPRAWLMDGIPENTFNITDLCFYRCDIPYYEFDWIISRIRALRSFRYYSNYDPGEEDLFPPDPSEKHFRRCLNIHRLTLEEIVISILYDEEYAELDGRRPISFSEFPVLKRLRINLEYLVPGFPIGSGYSGKNYKIIDSLPQSLERLCLEFLEKSVYSNTPDAQTTGEDLKRLFSYIEELEIDARSHAPVLMSVSLGDRRYDLHQTLDFSAGLTDVNRKFEAMGVALSTYHPRELRGFGEN